MTTLLSYDYRALSRYEADVRSLATGNLLTMFERNFSRAVRPVLTRTHATSTTKVGQVSYVSGDCARPSYLVRATQTVTSSSEPAGKTNQVTLTVKTRLVDGDYLLADVTPVTGR